MTSDRDNNEITTEGLLPKKKISTIKNVTSGLNSLLLGGGLNKDYSKLEDSILKAELKAKLIKNRGTQNKGLS